MKTLEKNIFIGIVLMLTFQAIETRAAWGDYDTSFGFGGVAVDSVTGYVPKDVAIQPDGKILVTGYRNLTLRKSFFLRRYLANGQLDVSFGNNGSAIFSETIYRGADHQGEKIVVLPDGKIAVAGRGASYYAVWQFTSTGRSDRDFGQSGLQVLTAYERNNRAPEINIQNGKLLLTFLKIRVSGKPVVLIRLHSNGTIDQTFGNSGESLTNLLGESPINHSFGTFVERDGKITISGKTSEDNTSKGLDRKLANGKPDLSFFPTSSPVFGSVMPGLLKLTNGKYFFVSNNSGLTFNLEEFTANGVFESSSTRDALSGHCPQLLANQSDGKVLIGFYGGRMIRMNTDLDFGSQEVLFCSSLIGVGSSVSAIQSDDKMMVVGILEGSLLLARFLPN